MDIKVFDSRDERFKKPFGAVAEKTDVHFRICLPRSLKCTAARLIVRDDFTAAETGGDLFWCGMENDDCEWWETDYVPEKPSLMFYSFSITTEKGERFIGKAFGSAGIITDEPSPWQLTVYSADFHTPDWLDGGIMYQIFPDSFCSSGKNISAAPEDRRMQKWGDFPNWKNCEDGVYRNNSFYGGDIAGIISKLDYIQSLGVNCIYINPIFESSENHRYSTADYTRIDPMLGRNSDFKKLCAEAKKLGIRVVLDGVFSHTGSDSVYFNRAGRYPTAGAFNAADSPYGSWYKFSQWPDKYSCWWGFESLPELDKEDESVREYFLGEGGVVRRWLENGASGWRLDVADELPDSFLEGLRQSVKAEDPEAIIIGEVWEDASNKMAYSKRRSYLLGAQLDSVMNYCFKDAIIGFLCGMDASDAMEAIMCILENYPPQVIRLLMNLVGTHDTSRLITELAGEPACGRGRDWQSKRQLTAQKREYGRIRSRLAAVLQYTLPGVPSVYYGDETCIEGYRDPFNRSCYPWGGEDTEQIEYYRTLGRIRRSLDCFTGARMNVLTASGRTMAYTRDGEKSSVLAAVNAGECDYAVELPERFLKAKPLIGEYTGGGYLCVPAGGAVILALGAPEDIES